MTRRAACPCCGGPLLVRDGVGGQLIVCRNGCPRREILACAKNRAQVAARFTNAAAAPTLEFGPSALEVER
jgi:hypothetical protein